MEIRKAIGKTFVTYRRSGNRLAVSFDSLRLVGSEKEKAREILKEKGFLEVEVDITQLARECIGKSQYRRGAKFSKAPNEVVCSTFTKWLYGQKGIWLPNKAVDQRNYGFEIEPNKVSCCDLIFATGRVDLYHEDSSDSVGHVGMVTEKETVIHAASSQRGIVETSIADFLRVDRFRGIRRYVPPSFDVITLEIPPDSEVETSDDLRWIILPSLKVTICH